MRKSPISFFILFFMYTFLHAGNTDSLQALMSNSEGVQKAAFLIELSNATVYHATADALEYATEALEIASDYQNEVSRNHKIRLTEKK